MVPLIIQYFCLKQAKTFILQKKSTITFCVEIGFYRDIYQKSRCKGLQKLLKSDENDFRLLIPLLLHLDFQKWQVNTPRFQHTIPWHLSPNFLTFLRPWFCIKQGVHNTAVDQEGLGTPKKAFFHQNPKRLGLTRQFGCRLTLEHLVYFRPIYQHPFWYCESLFHVFH